jgi:hypothetical protein
MPAPRIWAAARNATNFSETERRSQLSASSDGRLAMFWSAIEPNNGDIFNHMFAGDTSTISSEGGPSQAPWNNPPAPRS